MKSLSDEVLSKGLIIEMLSKSLLQITNSFNESISIKPRGLTEKIVEKELWVSPGKRFHSTQKDCKSS